MNLFKYTFLAFLVCLFASSQLQAQSRFKSEHLKYVNEARTQAIAGTLVPMALGLGTAWLVENKTIEKTASFSIAYGLVFGPSFGNFYAKDYLRGTLGLLARVGGVYLMADATRELAGDEIADGLGWDNESVSLSDPKVLTGAGIILASAIYNVISSKASVHRFNEKMGYIVQITPASYGDKVVPMLSATVNF